MIIEYTRLRADVRPPERANPSDAGLDLFFNPEPKDILPNPQKDSVVIERGRSVLLPTGYKFGIPHGYMLEIKNRSGIAFKRSLVVGACVVDSGYDGEVFVNLHNIGTEIQVIEPGTKIAQAVMVPVVHFRALETQNGDLYNWYPITISDRGDGALGSTDKKKE
jgi:deoxyuridine 5'-triphosphate nucleotidohydrolase